MKHLYLLSLFLFSISVSSAQFEILFVDDSDDEFGNAELFHAQIEAAGYPATYYNAVDSAVSPDDLYMSTFDLVIWHTSSDGTELLLWNALDEDNAALEAYLNSGGNLWLVGLDFLFDRYGTPPVSFAEGEFAYDYLGIDFYASQSYGDDGNLGVPSITPVSSSSIEGLNSLDWQFETLWWVDAVDVSEAEEIYRMSGDSYPLEGAICASLNSNDIFKVLTYYFDLSVVSSNQLMQENINAVMNYFNPSTSVEEHLQHKSLTASLFPNPSERPNLFLELEKGAEVEILVKDIFGRVISPNRTRLILPKGKHTIELPSTRNAPSGTYFVQLITDTQKLTLKWVK
jgi:hypothetical protein